MPVFVDQQKAARAAGEFSHCAKAGLEQRLAGSLGGIAAMNDHRQLHGVRGGGVVTRMPTRRIGGQRGGIQCGELAVHVA